MRVKILHEAGYNEAMLGLSLSHNQPVENMPDAADRLAGKDGGHNKFLESIVVWLDIIAPRYWWAQFDTYRSGITKQSESTMHTALKRTLMLSDFDGHITANTLERLNKLRERGDLVQLKRELPESFLQRRVVCTNYKTLRRMYQQRRLHKLPEWHEFCAALLDKLEHSVWME